MNQESATRRHVTVVGAGIVGVSSALRPTLPESLPVIGPSPVFENVYFAFGHQHIGLTGGPRTGRLIADLVAGRTPNIDIRPFRADRF